jgi:hypothetical protein
MVLEDMPARLEASPLAVAINAHDWAFPTIEVVHVVAISLVFGSILMVDLRLLGVARRGESAAALSRDLLPWTWGAFATAVTTGLLMFVTSAGRYIDNLPFRFKMAMLLLAGINMTIFNLTTHRSIVVWDRQMPPPAAARRAGGLSLILWVTIVILGRWIGFIDR